MPSSRLRETALERDHGQRRARRIAALVLAVRPRADPGLLLVLDGQDPVADGRAVMDGEILQAAGAFVAHHLEMIGLAADHDAERHEAVVTGAARLHAVEGEAD